MQEYKKVVVFKTGKKLNGTFYPKDTKIKLPKRTIVTIDFDENRIVGFAENFRQIKGDVICDITLGKGILDTVVPTIKTDRKKEMAIKPEIEDLSLTQCPADKSIKGNIYKSKKTKRRY